MHKPTYRRTYTRTTLPLGGTIHKPPAHLSFEADLALQYAGAWLLRAGSLKVPASATIRRALAVYAEHLRAADPAEEFHLVRGAAAGHRADDEGQRTALLRLYGADPEQPLPSFGVILRGPNAARKTAELTARAEELAQQVIASRPARRQAA